MATQAWFERFLLSLAMNPLITMWKQVNNVWLQQKTRILKAKIFNNYSKSARCASLALIISYLTSASGIIVLLKTPTKFREFLSTLSVKTTDFQLVFHIWRAWYSSSYTIMAKPIRALELNYPQIQFLIKWDSQVNRLWQVQHHIS